MRAAEPPFVDEAQQEQAHGPRGQQLGPAFGPAETRQVDGEEPRRLGEACPDCVPGKEAFGPRIEKENRFISDCIALGVSDGETIRRALLCVHSGESATSAWWTYR